MSTRLSMRMTCALLAGVAATVGFATPVVAQSSDLSSSFSKPSKPEAPKPSEKPAEKPAEKPTSEAPTPPAPDANKQSEAVLGKGYKATTKCEGRDGIFNFEFTAPEAAFYHVVLHDIYNLQEQPIAVVDRWVNEGEKVTFRKEIVQRHPLVLISSRVQRNTDDYGNSPLISKDSVSIGPCVYPGKEL